MLTDNQENFVKGIVEGKTATEAYCQAYPKQAKGSALKTIQENASRLLSKPKIKARLKELRDALAIPSIMTAQERLEYLTRVITGEEKEKVLQSVDGQTIEAEFPSSLKTKLTAVDIMNKMQGQYVQKVEAEVTKEVIINIELSDE